LQFTPSYAIDDETPNGVVYAEHDPVVLKGKALFVARTAYSQLLGTNGEDVEAAINKQLADLSDSASIMEEGYAPVDFYGPYMKFYSTDGTDAGSGFIESSISIITQPVHFGEDAVMFVGVDAEDPINANINVISQNGPEPMPVFGLYTFDGSEFKLVKHLVSFNTLSNADVDASPSYPSVPLFLGSWQGRELYDFPRIINGENNFPACQAMYYGSPQVANSKDSTFSTYMSAQQNLINDELKCIGEKTKITSCTVSPFDGDCFDSTWQTANSGKTCNAANSQTNDVLSCLTTRAAFSTPNPCGEHTLDTPEYFLPLDLDWKWELVVVETEEGPIAYFPNADEGVFNVELWSSDGTAEGTFKVSEINDNYEAEYTAGSWPSMLTAVGDKLFFYAYNEEYGNELHVTDGTIAGTRLVKDINQVGYTLAGANNVYQLGAPDHIRCYFDNGPKCDKDAVHYKNDDKSGLLTYNFAGSSRTEGNWFGSPNTLNALDNLVGQWDLSLHRINAYRKQDRLAIGGKLFFYADDGVHGEELWVSDGTEEGTTLVKDINAEVTIVTPNAFEIDTTATIPFTPSAPYPQGQSSSFYSHVDGTNVATQSFYQFFTEFEGKLYFIANDGKHGAELWVSDGTEEGTTLVKDINETPLEELLTLEDCATADSTPRGLAVMNDKLYFFANSQTIPYSLSAALDMDVYDGDFSRYSSTDRFEECLESTYKDYADVTISDVQGFGLKECFDYGVWSISHWGDQLFTLISAPVGYAVKYTGTTPSYYYKEIPVPGREADKSLSTCRGLLDDWAQELWVSDGTAEGTSKVYAFDEASTKKMLNSKVPVDAIKALEEFYVGDSNDHSFSFATVDSTYFFVAKAALEYSYETHDLAHRLVVKGDKLYFPQYDEKLGWQLYVSDGTKKGTKVSNEVFTATPWTSEVDFLLPSGAIQVGTAFETPQPLYGSNPLHIVVVGDKLIYGASSAQSSSERAVYSDYAVLEEKHLAEDLTIADGTIGPATGPYSQGSMQIWDFDSYNDGTSDLNMYKIHAQYVTNKIHVCEHC